ncbi:hypothetical protein BST81_22090 [Leptolyngbya sp. 'hensonii']|uniref:hypothetical protein n=1 Tax=Leptolyngbya sp. 'hensonii' TaxID=1922337 RepID=UPI00094FB649|nr:hypothetical protein [Leptolyngbya sp. 'hensonii']OLP16294.1 hypothetical protein BST81_22090 [Leptolyngbya sp. 'hensonii']
MNSVSSTDFKLHTELMVDALKTQDRNIILLFQQPFTALMGAKYVADLFTAAMHQLARTDAETCAWVLKNCYEPKLYLKMRKQTLVSAIRVLRQDGFVRGQDFQVVVSEQMWLNQDAREKLMRSISALDRVLLEAMILDNDLFLTAMAC